MAKSSHPFLPSPLRTVAFRLPEGFALKYTRMEAIFENYTSDDPDPRNDVGTMDRCCCDWALHASVDRTAAKNILRQFDDVHSLLREGIAGAF